MDLGPPERTISLDAHEMEGVIVEEHLRQVMAWEQRLTAVGSSAAARVLVAAHTVVVEAAS